MLFSTRQNIEQVILQLLQKGSLTTRELRTLLQRKEKGGVTKQGMYRVLRRLIRAEIVVKHAKQISLNVAWLTKMESFVSLAEHFYMSDNRSGSFLGLTDGEKIKYEFQTLKSTDAFWIHMLFLLAEANPNTPWFGYNPHDWFFLVRAESERLFRDFLIKNGGQYLMTSYDTGYLDRLIHKEFDDKNSQYYIRKSPLFEKNNYYLNVIGDYVIEVWIDPTQARAIENIYSSATKFTPDIEKQLQGVINSSGKTKLIVARDKKRAEKLKRMLAKPFYIPKQPLQH